MLLSELPVRLIRPPPLCDAYEREQRKVSNLDEYRLGRLLANRKYRANKKAGLLARIADRKAKRYIAILEILGAAYPRGLSAFEVFDIDKSGMSDNTVCGDLKFMHKSGIIEFVEQNKHAARGAVRGRYFAKRAEIAASRFGR